jgi:hypothetical protein
MYMYIYIHVYIYTHTQTHTHIHMSTRKLPFFFFLSLNLSIGWQLSIWNCCKPFFSLLYNYNFQLLSSWRLALSIAVEVFSRPLPLFLPYFEFSRQIFEMSSNIKFHENPSSGSRVVPCGQRDMTTLLVTFRNCSTAPKNLKHVADYRYLKKFHTQIQAQMAKNFDLINEESSLLKRKKL